MTTRVTPLVGMVLGMSFLGDLIPGRQSQAPDVIVYAADLSGGALSEWDFLNDPASPGGRMVGTVNEGGELDPPPEEDPHVTLKVRVQGGVPYRCWIHMKVGAPKGKSLANKIWVQFSGAVDDHQQETLQPGTGSYLTANAPARPGWRWVGCDAATGVQSQVRFKSSGEVTVRLQAGMEGVGFDQIVLSPARFLTSAPTDAVVRRP